MVIYVIQNSAIIILSHEKERKVQEINKNNVVKSMIFPLSTNWISLVLKKISITYILQIYQFKKNLHLLSEGIKRI